MHTNEPSADTASNVCHFVGAPWRSDMRSRRTCGDMFIPPTPSDSLSDSNCTHLLLASKTCSISPDYTIQQIIDQLEHVQYFIDNKTQKILLLHLIP